MLKEGEQARTILRPPFVQAKNFNILNNFCPHVQKAIVKSCLLISQGLSVSFCTSRFPNSNRNLASKGKGHPGGEGGGGVTTKCSHYLDIVAAKEIHTNVYVHYEYEGDWEETTNSM